MHLTPFIDVLEQCWVVRMLVLSHAEVDLAFT